MIRIALNSPTAIVTACAIAAATPVHADFTQTTYNGYGPTHEQFLETVYGGNFSETVDGNGRTTFDNGSITVVRMDDFGIGGGALNVLYSMPGDVTDQVWTAGGDVTLHATARFSKYNQSFGFFSGDAPGMGSFNELIATQGIGFDVIGEAMMQLPGNFRFGRQKELPDGTFKTWSSRIADNSDGLDHMIAFRVTSSGDDADARWLLFWEAGTNGDFNDLIIELAAYVNSEPVPLPAPFGLALVGLAGVAFIRRRSKLAS